MADLTRRRLLAAGALSLAAPSVLAACGADRPERPDRQAQDGRPHGEVSVWLHGSQETGPQFEKLVHRYIDEFGVDVKLLYLPVAQLDAKLLTAFSGGTPPDVFKIGHWSFPSHAGKERLAPIDPRAFGAPDVATVLGRYEPGTVAPLSYRGQAYGVPIDLNPAMLYYRRDRFEEAGLDPDKPPTTWEEVADHSKRLTSADGRRVGLQWLYGDPQWALMTLTALIKGGGGELVSADGTRASLDTEHGIRALEYFAGIGNPKLSNPLGALGLFYSGEAAMVVSGAFLGPALERLGEDTLKPGKDYGVAPMPRWEGGRAVVPAYTWGWGVAAASKNGFTAWHLINYLQGRESVTANLENGIVIPATGWRDAGPRGTSELMGIAASGIPDADFGPAIPAALELAKAASSACDAVAHGRSTPARAAKDFDATVRLAL
ncbi:ABC transporter substrate-binding protein [Streptosporangium sp. NPDC001681]|uniref:ABC transporter substrate-binding protein n=1 Tax=Streptosporangium sp. NPDC001681 TaxID=3154395 RepID=UPI00331D94DE